MKRKIFIFIMLAVFLFTQTAVVDARSRGGSSFGGGRSFSSKSWGGSSSSRSWGSTSNSKSGSGSSSSKSSGWGSSSGSSGKSSSGSSGGSSSRSSSGYSGSSKSSRNVPGSYSTGSSGAKKSTASSTRKNTYMQDAYKKQASTSNYTKYKQNLNAEQKKAYDSAMNSNYTARNRMNFEDSMRTRASRIRSFSSRPVYINVNPVYFGSPFSYGYAHVGMWDLFFLMHASDLFWYHHWNDIYPYRDYFQAAQLADMEARVKRLEQQNNGVRDASYMDPNVDPDLQVSDEYQQAHPESVYYTNKYSTPGNNAAAVIIVILVIVILLIVVLRKASRSKPKKTYNSRIY